MDFTEEDDDKKPFLIRHRLKLIVAAMALAGIGAFMMSSGERRPMRKAAPVERIVSITPPRPLPPPPPRPPEPQQRPEPTPRADDMVVQEPLTPQDQTPPEAPASEPDNSTDAPGPVGEAMGTNIQGDGSSNSWGLSGKGGGGIIGGGGGGGTGRGGGSRWGWYASHMQGRIERALQDNDKTRSAGIDLNVRLWADATGRITHAQLVGSTGDVELDRVLKREVLTGLAMREAPPSDMPQPILIRILGLRPE